MKLCTDCGYEFHPTHGNQKTCHKCQLASVNYTPVKFVGKRKRFRESTKKNKIAKIYNNPCRREGCTRLTGKNRFFCTPCHSEIREYETNVR